MKLYKRLFVDCLFCNVTELLWCSCSWERLLVRKMHHKKANAETLCKIWFVLFFSWLPSSMSNHDGKWVFYHYHIYTHEGMWSKIWDFIRSITKNSDYYYSERYLKIKLDLDDDWPLNKTMKNFIMIIVVRAVFYENNK